MAAGIASAPLLSRITTLWMLQPFAGPLAVRRPTLDGPAGGRWPEAS